MNSARKGFSQQSCHQGPFGLRSIRVSKLSSKRPYGLTCSQISGVRARRSVVVNWCRRGPEPGPRFALRGGAGTRLSGRGSNGQVRLRDKRGARQQRLGIPHRCRRIPDAGPRFALRNGALSLLSGRGSNRQVRLPDSLRHYPSHQRRLGLPHRRHRGPQAGPRFAFHSGHRPTQWPWIQRASSPT
jgi:hypothetical protein